MGLSGFERRLERLVEGVFAKTFRSGLAPVEVAKRITREMDLGRKNGVRGVVAPNQFTVGLSAADHEEFVKQQNTLLRELAAAVREHARDESYRLLGPVEVVLEQSTGFGKGEFGVRGEIVEATGGGAAVVLPDGSRVELGDEPVTIGRLGDCDVALLSDVHVSKQHAEIRPHDGEWIVVDLASMNGTRVNGAGVTERVLKDGDEITVGSTTLRFEGP